MRRIVLCRLVELMKETGTTFKDLIDIGLNNNLINDLRNNQWKRVTRETLEKLCEVFQVPISEILISVAQNLWGPATGKSADVNLHVGRRSLDGEPSYEKEVMFSADVRACNVLRDHLKSLRVSGVRMVGHSLGLSGVSIALLRSGVHVIVGSPIANPMTEPAVRDFLYQVGPSAPASKSPFPYTMEWSDGRTLGTPAVSNQIGIYSRDARQLLARRRELEDGTAEDCALLLARRFKIEIGARFLGDSRLVLIVIGHGSVGTHAGAIAAVRPDVADEMFPPELGVVTAGVIRVKYDRPQPGSSEPPVLVPELVQVADTIVEGEFAGQTDIRRIAVRSRSAGA